MSLLTNEAGVRRSQGWRGQDFLKERKTRGQEKKKQVSWSGIRGEGDQTKHRLNRKVHGETFELRGLMPMLFERKLTGEVGSWQAGGNKTVLWAIFHANLTGPNMGKGTFFAKSPEG